MPVQHEGKLRQHRLFKQNEKSLRQLYESQHRAQTGRRGTFQVEVDRLVRRGVHVLHLRGSGVHAQAQQSIAQRRKTEGGKDNPAKQSKYRDSAQQGAQSRAGIRHADRPRRSLLDLLLLDLRLLLFRRIRQLSR